MERISFTDMITPRSKYIADQQAQAQGQYALGDRLAKSVGNFADMRTKNANSANMAKAQELQAQITSEWNDPNGLFKGLANDSDKARKASSLLAPWDRELSQKWLAQANEFKSKEEAGNLSREKLKSEEDYNLRKLDQEGATKERELALKQAELDAKGNAPVKIEAQDYKNAMSAFTNGTYPQHYMQVTANGTNNLANVLPSPNLDPAKIDASLTAGVSGDLVKARTIAEQTQGTKAGEAKKDVDLTSAKLGLNEDELKAVQAKKDLGFEKSQGIGALAPQVRDIVETARSEYQKKANAIDSRDSQLRMLDTLLASGDPNAFNAIGSIITFNKILDPNSVVREAEFAIAQGATGILDGLSQKLSSYVDGNNITPEGVKALKDFSAKMRKYLNDTKSIAEDWAIKEAQRIGAGVQPQDITGGIAKRTGSTIAPAQSATTETPQTGILQTGDFINVLKEGE